MRAVFYLSLISLLTLGSCSAKATERYWKEYSNKAKELSKKSIYYKLDFSYLKSYLDTAFSDGNLATLILPNSHNNFSRFQISEYPIMEQKLADKFPEIKTYYGFNINQPNERVFLDISPKGLHTMTIGGGKTIWIEPTPNQGKELYQVYQPSKKIKDKFKNRSFKCKSQNNKNNSFSAAHTKLVKEALPMQQDTLRTFKIAIAASGEYTQFHSNGVANVESALASIVTSLVRINGIYETELAVRMILVGDNDKIIFTDPNTDPYDNSGVDENTYFNQNQLTLDSIIGNSNYDIGHLYVVDDGGMGNFNSACDTTTKAMGFTGGNPPNGDPFWVSSVAHEIGHQWGADHTFNSNTEICESARSSFSAYEPGSGSTIMGYPKICDGQNLQNEADPYFHSQSLEEMDFQIDSLTSSLNSCGIQISINNKAPLITMPNGQSIPKSTPFELCSNANDPDTAANLITYNWEQFDLGPAGHPNMPAGNAPIFRSFLPSINPCRTFPKQTDLLANTQTIGEILPSYARELNFRVTVRDNKTGGGAFNTAAMSMNVTNDGPFLLTSPNGTEVLNYGGNMNVIWDVAGTNTGAINCPNVDISASQDGGFTFPFTLLANTPNDGSQEIPVPGINSKKIRFKVKCSNNVFFDISNANLEIKSSVALDSIYKNGFEVQ